jgi:hypothetical protein
MDPRGFPAVLLSASWFVPMAALAVYSLRRPETATTVLTVPSALVASFVVLDGVFGMVPRDEIGPVASIIGFAVAVPLGFLGLRRPLRAGWLLLLRDKPRRCSRVDARGRGRSGARCGPRRFHWCGRGPGRDHRWPVPRCRVRGPRPERGEPSGRAHRVRSAHRVLTAP